MSWSYNEVPPYRLFQCVLWLLIRSRWAPPPVTYPCVQPAQVYYYQPPAVSSLGFRALSHPRGFISVVVSSGYASTAEGLAEIRRLISRLPAKMRLAIETGEARGRFDDPRYKRAIAEFMQMHFSDLRVTPYNLTMGTLNTKIHRAMMSDPEAFTVTGNLTSWNVKPKLKQIRVPTLVTVGARDLVTPACARAIHRGINGSRLVMFRKSGHDALFKERELYIEVVRNFLDNVLHQ